MPCSFSTVISCEISTWTWRRILYIQRRTCREHSLCFRRMELFSRNRWLPVLRNGTLWLWQGGMLRCLVFWWLGESRTLCNKEWSGDVCVCVYVSLVWMLSLETLSPVPQQKDIGHAFFSYHNQCCGGGCGISFCLGMWSLTLGFVSSKFLAYTVNLFDSPCRQELLKYNSDSVWCIYWHIHDFA